MDKSTMEDFNILIITDSRSANMRHKLQKALLGQYNPDMTIHVEALSSDDGSLSNLASLAEANKLSNGDKFDFLYLVGGSEGLLYTDSGRSGCVFEWVGSLVDVMYEKLFQIRNRLFNVAHRPVICEMVGMNLSKCDTFNPTDCRIDQDTIKQGIPHLNRAICSINKDIQVVSPWLGSTIHAMIHHKIHHKYQRLEDGYHPGEELNNIWAMTMAKAIVKNCAWFDKP